MSSSNNPRSRAAFTLALHRAIAQGGLSLERDLVDWFGETRLTELMDGAAPLPEEAAAMARLTADPGFLAPTESAIDDLEPIEQAVTRPFPTSTVIASISTVVAVGALFVTGVVLQSAAELRQDAVDAEAFSARLVTTLAEELPHDTNSGVFEAIAADALARYNAGGAINDPAILRDWSRLFTIVGTQRSNTGDIRGAREAFETALNAAERRVRRAPGDINAVFDHSQAAFWLADFNYRNGDFDAAEAGYDLYASLTAQLLASDPDRPLYQAEYAYGYLNAAILDLERGRSDEALEGFTLARDRLAAVSQASDVVGSDDVANVHAWRADALFALGAFSEAADNRASEIALYDLSPPGNTRRELRRAGALSAQANALLQTGDVERATTLVSEGLALIDGSTVTLASDVRAQRIFVELMAQRAELLLADGNAIGAKLVLDSARNTVSIGLEGSDRVIPAREVAYFALRSADVALALGAYQSAIDEVSAALRLLAEDETPDLFTVSMQARAYEALGLAEMGLGRSSLAERAWRQGLHALEDGVGFALEDVYRARLAHRTGDFDTAQTIYARLQNLGYAHPLDSAFWREASNAGVVQRVTDGDMNDG